MEGVLAVLLFPDPPPEMPAEIPGVRLAVASFSIAVICAGLAGVVVPDPGADADPGPFAVAFAGAGVAVPEVGGVDF